VCLGVIAAAGEPFVGLGRSEKNGRAGTDGRKGMRSERDPKHGDQAELAASVRFHIHEPKQAFSFFLHISASAADPKKH
jgi:hypothetical protein